MYYVLLGIILLCILFIGYVIERGYPKYGWFKKILHDKLKIHTPDIKNWLDYNTDTKIVYSACKHCNKEIVYRNVCIYLVNNNPEKIPNSMFDSYCRECVTKNYTRNKNCCPRTCGELCTCQTCERNNE